MAPTDEFRRLLRESAPVDAARRVLGGTLTTGRVALTVVEVEAYGGPEGCAFPDPAAHTWPGPTPRNEVMFGDAGHLYVYLSHGIHHCLNVTCRNIGEGGGLLLRGARVARGLSEARRRRPGITDRHLARGPGNLGRTAGLTLEHRGLDLLDPDSDVRFHPGPALGPSEVATGPRVGVSAAADRPWRVWIPGAPEVSAYRRSPRAPAGPAMGDNGSHG